MSWLLVFTDGSLLHTADGGLALPDGSSHSAQSATKPVISEPNSLRAIVRQRSWQMLVVFYCIYTVLFFGFGLWHWLGIPPPWYTPIFGDLLAVTTASDCHLAGYDVFVENPCDPEGRPHVYGRLWLAIGALGLTVADTTWLGACIVAMFVVVATVVLGPKTPRQAVIGATVVASPPIMLALERGNNDVIVFMMIAAAAILANSSAKVWRAGSLLLVFLATALKFYPIVCLCVPVVQLHRRRALLVAFVAVLAVITAAFVALSLGDLMAVRDAIPQPLGPRAFGAKATLGHLDQVAPPLGSVLAVAGAAAMLVLASWLATRLDLDAPVIDSRPVVMFLMGAVVLLFTFFAVSNYIYRWIYVILLLPYLFMLMDRSSSQRLAGVAARVSIGLVIVGLWAGAPSMILGDPAAGPTRQLLGVGFFLVQQASTWLALTLILTIALRVVLVTVNVPTGRAHMPVWAPHRRNEAIVRHDRP